MVGWIVVGLLTSVTGELILPGRNPAGIGVALLLGAAGSLLARFVVGLLGGEPKRRGSASRRSCGPPWGRSRCSRSTGWVRVFEHGSRRGGLLHLSSSAPP
jgi:uncharacterized membrane protein YeaQ/YmgE (transglycosylase-associated protein family)